MFDPGCWRSVTPRSVFYGVQVGDTIRSRGERPCWNAL